MSAVDWFDLDLDSDAAMCSHAVRVAADGGDKSECPVGPSHPHWSTWQRAWSSHRSMMERGSGAMRYRTNLMKAEVRRQMDGLPEYQPDPTAEVCPERHRHHGNHVHVNITVDTSELMKAMREAAQKAADAFTRSMQDVLAVFEDVDLKGLLAVANPEPVDPIARLRHGSAAYCPRHGATKGGTCMKCARGRR